MPIDMAAYLRWRPAFAAAMDPRLHTPAWLDALLLSGHAQLWCSPDAAAVTEVRTYPTGARDVHGLVAAGNVSAVRDILLPRIERWGRAIGALGIVIESRPGWVRVLKDSGFAPHQLAIRKELGEPQPR